jgi:hypothetical protein
LTVGQPSARECGVVYIVADLLCRGVGEYSRHENYTYIGHIEVRQPSDRGEYIDERDGDGVDHRILQKLVSETESNSRRRWAPGNMSILFSASWPYPQD